jgi:hypothetical protein
MPINAFINKTKQPTDAEIAAALEPARPVWDQLLAALSQAHGTDIHEWKSYSVKAGWALRVKRKARTVVKTARDIGPLMRLAAIKLAH